MTVGLPGGHQRIQPDRIELKVVAVSEEMAKAAEFVEERAGGVWQDRRSDTWYGEEHFEHEFTVPLVAVDHMIFEGSGDLLEAIFEGVVEIMEGVSGAGAGGVIGIGGQGLQRRCQAFDRLEIVFDDRCQGGAAGGFRSVHTPGSPNVRSGRARSG